MNLSSTPDDDGDWIEALRGRLRAGADCASGRIEP
jgi:hypothetical protein